MGDSRRSRLPWKQNYLRIPDSILHKIGALPNDEFVVACVRRLRSLDAAGGLYAHLDIRVDQDRLVVPERIVPRPDVGRYSTYNVGGREIVRRDLPKVTKTYSWDAPNYGDWSKGSHEVSMDRDVNQREFLPPPELALTMEILAEEEVGDKQFVLRFTVGEMLDRRRPEFEQSLLFDLNLLQENVGGVDIFASDARLDEYLDTIYVDWELLPPGTREDTIARVLAGVKGPTEELRRKLVDRYRLLEELQPVAFVQGRSGFRRYFGAKFTEDLVTFENLEYGNAVYVMYEDWQTLSQLSRLELLSSARQGFTRVIHRDGWMDRLKKLIAQRRQGPAGATT